MSTKYTNSNLFELLQVDNDLPDQKRTKTQANKKPAETGPNVETPAEKAQRRKAVEAQKAAAAAAEKQRKETEQAMAAAFPQEGWEVQKGSQAKKQTEKGKVLNREQFNEKSPETEPKKPFVKGPITGRKFDERKPGEKQQHPRGDHQLKQNVTRPNKHEGYDKHSGGKTTNKPPPKKGGAGAGNWGEDPQTVSEWDTATAAAPPTGTAPGWGDEGEPKVATTSEAPGWGDDKETKSDKSDKSDKFDKEDDKPKKAAEAAWDDEGFGKMTLEEFQETVAAKRAKDLAALTGSKAGGRQIENTVDLSKCTYKNSADEKEKKMAEDRKKEKADEAKRRGQQRAGVQNVDLSQYIDVRTRGGRGGGRGRGGDRPPRNEEGQSSPEPGRTAGRGGRGGGRGGDRAERGGKLKPSAFPALEKPVATQAAPKATK